jgi:3-phenylpropionate/cinnamic acid dioxygenase small subunit
MEQQEIVDRLQILDLLARYCQTIDDQDWAAFQNLFAAGAVLDFSAFGGPVHSVTDMIGFLQPVLAALQRTQHTISTLVLDIAGETAKARTAALVLMIYLDQNGEEQIFSTGLWYRDQLVRENGAWKIKQRQQEYGWVHNPSPQFKSG